MELFAIIAALVAAALAAEAFFAGRSGMPRLLRELYVTGLPFLAVGILLGKSGANVIDDELYRRLDPLVLLGLGSIGFLYGVHLERRRLRMFPARLYGLMSIESTLTLLAVGAVSWAVLPALGIEGVPRFAAALVIGAASSGTSPGSIFHMGIERRLRSLGFEMARFVSTLDDLPGLAVLGLLFAFTDFGESARPIAEGMSRVGAYAALGFGTGLLQISVFSLKLNDQESGLAVLGVIALSSAVSSIVGICPLFTNLLAGIVSANFCIEKERVYEALARREHTIYLLFMVLIGSRLALAEPMVIVLAAAVIATRTAAKVAGWQAGALVLSREMRRGPVLRGLGMLPQGGMAVGMAATYFRNGPAEAGLVITTLVLSLALNGLAGAEIGIRVFSAEET